MLGPLLHPALVASLLLSPTASPPALRRFRRAPPPALLSGVPEPSDAIDVRHQFNLDRLFGTLTCVENGENFKTARPED